MFTRFMELLKRKNNKKGFTLVELMVVVVILGILVAIAVPVYNNVTSQATEKADAANIRIIEGAAQMYIATQTNPSDVDLAKTEITSSCAIAAYLKEPPIQPGTSSHYYITIADSKVTVTKN